MDFLKILLLGFLFYSSIFAQRLGNNVTPSNYKIELTLEELSTATDFMGTVEIQIKTESETSEIILNSLEIDYESAEITIEAAEPTTDESTESTTEGSTTPSEGEETTEANTDEDPIYTVTYEELEDNQQIKLTIDPILPSGEYILKFANYKAKLHDDMYGFYLSTYKNEAGEEQFVATTQFQPTYARRAFPCFDEPAFKATFDVTINRPEGYTSLSNTGIAHSEGTKDIFETTPKMSTYLLAFIVSKFKNYKSTIADDSEPYDVWCREEAIETAEFAYETGIDVLQKFDELFGIPYYTKGVDKMDQVAIPDFAAGAMENWGLVTYRETALLWDKDHSTVNYLQRVATVIAHEFAHMWFGNIVTLSWWQYTWLNEGFARYYQYFLTHKVFPDWELDKQFVIEQQQVIFESDAVAGNHLNKEASTPTEISNKFASISYNKGASIIRMMKNFLGDAAYEAGIVEYLTEHEYGNTEPDDLYASLTLHQPENFEHNLKDIMDTWTEQDGYPVVTVSRNRTGLVLKQERFLLSSDSSDNSWYIPITYTTQDEAAFTDTTVRAWMKDDEVEILIKEEDDGDDDNADNEEEDKGWVLVNILETGYYRVNYADDLWDKLEEALKAGANFDDINKAQIVDDALNLARANRLSYAKALNVTSFLEDETSYYPWYAAFNAFSFLRKRIDNSGEAGQYLDTHISTLMEKLYASVSFEPVSANQVETLKTALALRWACQLGNEDCISKANDQFATYTSGEDIEPNIRSTVYCSAVRQDETDASFNLLWERFGETDLSTEENTILTALGCSRNADILKTYLGYSIDEESNIRKQDSATVFTSVLAGNPENVNTAFEFFIDNIEAISSYYEGMNALSTVLNGIADRITTQEQVDQLKEFAEANTELLKDAEHQIASALETAQANVDWAQANEEELFNWLDATYGSAASITLSLTLFIVTITTVFLNF